MAATVRMQARAQGASGDPGQRLFISDHALPWLLPLIAMLVVFAIYPLGYSIWLSFHVFVPLERSLQYVGGANWVELFSDSQLLMSLAVTLKYTAVCLTIELVLGMAIALLIDSDDPGFSILQALLTLTLVIPPVIAGMMFLLMENAQFGVLTYFLKEIGILEPRGVILSDPQLAFWGVVLADVWQWTPFMVLIFIAGLRSLPQEPFESAQIDGAGPLQIFRHLTLPMLGKVIAIAVLIRGIDLLRMFDYVYVMTSGGPGMSTYTLSLYAWEQTFSFVRWGYGAAISLLLLVIMFIAASTLIAVARVRW